MPTPSDNTPQLPTATIIADDDSISGHTTCPPDIERPSAQRDFRDPSASAERNAVDDASAFATAHSEVMRSDDGTGTGTRPAHTPTNTDSMRVETGLSGSGFSSRSTTKSDDEVERLSPAGEPSPSSGESSSSVTSSPSMEALLSYEFSNVRLLPNYTSSFLRPGSKFTGTQQSDRQVYNVDVEIKHVDMAESYLCGYLRIQGLTEDHPTLTTFFEGEIIGTKHTFQTRHEAWGATDKTDMSHWARFDAWRPLAQQAKRPDFTYRNFAQREHIFMRWKEYFLVPDHRVRTISGASFEGFYYICFNQIAGTVTGIYFHAKSEKYQKLELKHVEDRGCTPALEFR